MCAVAVWRSSQTTTNFAPRPTEAQINRPFLLFFCTQRVRYARRFLEVQKRRARGIKSWRASINGSNTEHVIFDRFLSILSLTGDIAALPSFSHIPGWKRREGRGSSEIAGDWAWIGGGYPFHSVSGLPVHPSLFFDGNISMREQGEPSGVCFCVLLIRAKPSGAGLSQVLDSPKKVDTY